MKRTSKKWLHEYFGLDINEINDDLYDHFGNTNVPIYQFDGGRGTWNFDKPDSEKYDYLCIHQSNSKTYFAVQYKEKEIER